MKRRIAVLAFLILFSIFLSSCIFINDVEQTDSWTLGVPFTSTVTTTITWDDEDDVFSCTPVFAVKLPEFWQVVSCTALFDTATYVCDTEDPDHLAFLPEPTDGTWYSFRMFDDATGPRNFNIGDVIVVTWTIRPTTVGYFELDYWASVDIVGYGYASNVLANIVTYNPFGHDITIAAASSIPTLNEYAMLILSGLLVFASIVFLKSKKDTKMKMPFAVILAVLGGALVLFSQSPEVIAQDSRIIPPTPENFKLIAVTESPRDEILNKFDWSEEERQWLVYNLPKLTDEDLQAALQVFSESENPENIRCMISNTDSPKLKCVDCTHLSEE